MHIIKANLPGGRLLYGIHGSFLPPLKNKPMEKTGYALLAIVAIIWIGVVIGGLVMAFPFGLIGLVGILGLGFLLIKVISDRLSNKEDDHYSDNVDK